MTETELKLERVAEILAEEAGYPRSLRELFLPRAYILAYHQDVGSKRNLARIEGIIAKEREAKKKGRTLVQKARPRLVTRMKKTKPTALKRKGPAKPPAGRRPRPPRP